MTDWRDRFCGRAAELAALREAYDAVARGGGPRLVVVVGDRGMGKTRLVREFYAWLCRERDPDDYWPDVSLFRGRNLLFGPDVERDPAVRAHFASFTLGERRMRFLWWGIRLADADDRNAVPTDLAGHRRALDLHLEPLRHARRMDETRAAAVGLGLDVVRSGALKAVEFIPGAGPAISAMIEGASVLYRRVKIRAQRQALEEQHRAERVARVAEARTDLLTESTLEELAALFAAGAGTDAAATNTPADTIPLVLFVDDAQFARPGGDEGVLRLIRQLWRRAVLEGWPLLLVATHWDREWSAADEYAAEPDFAAYFRPLLRRLDTVHALVLGPEPALAQLVHAGLGALPPHDVELIVGRADGNPQLLIEIVDRIARSPAWRSADGALSPVGRRHLETARFELHDLIRRRMESDTTSDDVRRAVAVSSVQGVEFSCALAETVAELLRAGPVRDGLEAAENTHRFVAGVAQGAAGFLQRAYRDAALALVDGQFGSQEIVHEALARAVDTMLADPGRWAGLGAAEQDAVLALRVAFGEHAPDAAARHEAARTAAMLALRARGGANAVPDVARAAFWARRFQRGLADGRWAADVVELGELQVLEETVRFWDGAAAARHLAQALVERLHEQVERDGAPELEAGLIAALQVLGLALEQELRVDLAEPRVAEALGRARALHEREPGVAYGRLLVGALQRMAALQLLDSEAGEKERLLREMVALTGSLRAAHGDDNDLTNDHVAALVQLAYWLERDDDPGDEVPALLQSALSLQLALFEREPRASRLRDLGAIYLAVVENVARRGDAERARSLLPHALEALHDAFEAMPRQESRFIYARALGRAADLSWGWGDAAAALDFDRQARALLEAVSPAPDPTHAARQMGQYVASARYQHEMRAGEIFDPAPTDALGETLHDLLERARPLLDSSAYLRWTYAELAGRLSAHLELRAMCRGEAAGAATQLRATTDALLRQYGGSGDGTSWYQGLLIGAEAVAAAARRLGRADDCARTHHAALRWALEYAASTNEETATGDLFYWIIVSGQELLDVDRPLETELLRACARVLLAPAPESEPFATARFRSPALSILATLGSALPRDERLALLDAAMREFEKHDFSMAWLAGFEARVECGLWTAGPATWCQALTSKEAELLPDADLEPTARRSFESRFLARLRRKWRCTPPGSHAGPVALPDG